MLEGDLTIASAPELKERLLEAVKSGKAIAVSLAGVRSLDITSIQLLWAACRQCQAEGGSLTLTAPVPAQIAAKMEAAGIPWASLVEGE